MCIYNGWWLSHPVKNKQICETGNLPQTGWTCAYIAYIPYNVCPSMHMVQQDLKAGGFIQESTIWRSSCLVFKFKTKPSGPHIIHTLHYITFHFITWGCLHMHNFINIYPISNSLSLSININIFIYPYFQGYPKWSKQDGSHESTPPVGTKTPFPPRKRIPLEWS